MKVSYSRIVSELLDAFIARFREAASPRRTAPEGDNGPFQYTPLPSLSSFRILQLKYATREAATDYTARPLRGTLIHASIDSPPEYYALSYHWGDAALCETIEIDGKLLRITANCAAALRRMLRGKAQRLVWVDSICINQASTTEALQERSVQVGMMDRIYMNAAQVNVYLGEGDPGSDAACSALRKLSFYYLGARAAGPQQGLFRKKYESLADETLLSQAEYPYGKLYGVFRLPWFTRVWVVQEVVCGRNVVFYCGRNLLHFKMLAAGSDFTRLPYSKLDHDASYRHWRSYLEYHDAFNEFVQRREGGEPASNFRLTLASILLPPALLLEATRPEDKIYGVYGVCKRLGFDLPTPDYHKPLAAIYTEAARAILRYDADLIMFSAICESSGWEWGLPSWVPNFSGCIRRWTPSNPPHMTLFGNESPAISGHTQCQKGLSPDGMVLSVRGRRLDMLCASGLPWMTDATTNLLGGSHMQTGQYISSFIECVGSWFDITQGLDTSQGAEATTRLLARVLVQYGAPWKQPPTQNLEPFARCLSVLVAWSKSDVAFHGSLLGDPQENIRPDSQLFRVGDYVLSTLMKDFIMSIALNHWKNVFRTRRGYLGIGPHTVQDGDIVAVFHGSSFAAVLRPYAGQFKYIGPAYVDGVMNGEFWGAGSPRDDEWFALA